MARVDFTAGNHPVAVHNDICNSLSQQLRNPRDWEKASFFETVKDMIESIFRSPIFLVIYDCVDENQLF